MPKTVLYMATSLDGFIAGKDDDLSWLEPYQNVDYDFESFFANIGAIIQGRRSFEIELRNGWEYPRPVPLLVMSNTIPPGKPARPNLVFTHGDIADVLKSAHAKAGRKDVWVEGGANVAQQFIGRGLLDEMVITLAPILLGKGTRLFEAFRTRFCFSLRDVKRFEKGLVQLHYASVRGAPCGNP